MPLLLRILAVLLLLLGGLPLSTAGVSLEPGWPTAPSSSSSEEENEERADPVAPAREARESAPTRAVSTVRAAPTPLPAGHIAAPLYERGARPERRAPLRC